MKHYNSKNIKLIELTINDPTTDEFASGNFSDKHSIKIEFMDGSCEYEEFGNLLEARRRLSQLQELLK